MNAHNLHDALNELDSGLIEEVDQLRSKPKRQKRVWQRLLAVAACLGIVAVSMLAVRELRPIPSGDDSTPITSQIENRPANADSPTDDRRSDRGQRRADRLCRATV